MTNFIIQFFICNLFMSGIIGIFLLVKHFLKNILTSRMQYHLWFLLLGLLAVPFIPVWPAEFGKVLSWIGKFKIILPKNAETAIQKTIASNPDPSVNWINDFTLSVSSKAPSIASLLLLNIWLIGIIGMIILLLKSRLQLETLKKSALPLQNQEVRKLYQDCLDKMNITKTLPICSTAFLKSPIIIGLFKPCIYLPIHLISDYNITDMRYILLHELHHYKYKDALSNYLINIAVILYWFNPFVWYALRQMRDDREIACDTSVLQMLEENDYEAYGNTLISFAEKISLSPFPFAAGIGGNKKQIEKRIINIVSYEKPTIWKYIKSVTAFLVFSILLLSLTPLLSTYALDNSYYHWKPSTKNISHIDLSSYFGNFEGSFVLYDLENDCWSIYNIDQATQRVSPNSTYKIYTALFGLEENIITPNNSFIAWKKEIYPFDTWNNDQTLQSAMRSSVNWYFQSIDKKLGSLSISKNLHKIKYGNENIGSDLSSYWLESSLKISPVEQVELLTKFYNNDFGFSKENINAVKNSICLSSSKTKSLYGKTGTGRVDGKDINGWFIGFIESSEHTCFFATNISSSTNATGNNASKITLSILEDAKKNIDTY